MNPPRDPGQIGGAGISDQLGSESGSRDSKRPSPNQAPTELPFKVSEYVTIEGSAAKSATAFLHDMTLEAFLRQGPAAFDCPKSAACVHEAGHCIIYAIQDIVPKFARIK